MSAGQFAHMDPGAVGTAMTALGKAGQTLETEWGAARSGIDAGEAGIGGGPLGAAFRGVYDAERTSARQTADGLPRAIIDDAAVGARCAEDYRAADQASAAGFRGAGR